jgi:uncharacterized protein with HEPN domain
VIPAFTSKTSSTTRARPCASSPDIAPAIADGIPHSRAIIGFRNILAHGYAELDHNKVYDIAITYAPELLVAVREALKDFPAPTAA